jgi:iron complex outermembrane recepter protein
MFIKTASVGACFILSLSASLTAYAQSTTAQKPEGATAAQTPGPGPGPSESGELQEIIVTAERREADLQKTALSVSALTADQVQKTGITTFDTLLQNIPGVQVQSSGDQPATPYISIRGLGTDGANKPGATAVYLDGVIVDALGLELYDISRVEVLRGPQGTLYGGVATGGAVNIITNAPSFDGYSGFAQVQAGTYALLHSIGVLNAPLSDTVALRVAVSTSRRNEYSDDSTELNSEVNARVKLLIKPNDSLSILLGGEDYQASGPIDDGLRAQDASGHVYGPYVPRLGYGNRGGFKGYADIDWDLDFARLTSITAFQRYKQNYSTSNTLYPSSGDDIEPKRDTTTQEFRLSSEPSSPVSWIGGLWYKGIYALPTVNVGFEGVLPLDALVPGPGGVPVSNEIISVPQVIDSKEYGVFGQVTIPLGDTTRFTGGVRYSRDDIQFDQYLSWTSPLVVTQCPDGTICTIPTLFDQRFTSTDWLARLEQDLSSSSLVYAMASTGYRPGGPASPRGSYSASQAIYGAEHVRSYEVGSKNRFVDNRLQVNGALYYNNYPSFQNNLTLYGPDNSQLPAIVPVAAKFYGAELEAQAAVTQDDRVGLSFSYIHAQYTQNASFTDTFTNVTYGIATDGKSVPHAPKYQTNLNYDHYFHLPGGSTLVGSIDGHYQTAQAIAFDACLYNPVACTSEGLTYNQLVQGSYILYDLVLGYNSPNERFSTTMYCRNCGDKTIKIFNESSYAELAPPRTVGITLSEKF